MKWEDKKWKSIRVTLEGKIVDSGDYPPPLCEFFL